MNLYDDTIAAISTPTGEGGIGIVRISGKKAIEIGERIFVSPKEKNISSMPSFTMRYGYIKTPRRHKGEPAQGERDIADEVILSLMREPYTYTREDIVEINCHGGAIPLRKILNIVLNEGARLAEPGEFTMRAFINGRIDLTRAEAVIDVIKAKTDESFRLAAVQMSGGLSQRIEALKEEIINICAHVEACIDFPEEEIEPSTQSELTSRTEALVKRLQSLSNTYERGRLFREGLSVAIVGRPNAGKSSLLNALLEKERAIVTNIPGTTRDTIEEYLDIKGFPVKIIDTAGIGEVRDLAEKEGVRRSLQAIEGADIILALFDGSLPLTGNDIEVIQKTSDRKTIYVINKSDAGIVIKETELLGILGESLQVRQDEAKSDNPVNGAEDCKPEYSNYVTILNISAKTGEGLEKLKESLVEHVESGNEAREGIIITRARHKTSIDGAANALKRALELFESDRPLEIVSIELREALERLGEIAGAVTTDEILGRIFNEFCIGK